MDSASLAYLALGIAEAIVIVAAVFWLGIRPLRERERRAVEEYRKRLEEEAEIRASAALLDAKEEALKIREHAEEELRQTRASLERQEARLCAREESLDARRDQLAQREGAIAAQEAALGAQLQQAARRCEEADEALERAASLGREEARELLLQRVEAEARELALSKAREVEVSTLQEAERRARKAILDSVQRLAVEYVHEATTAIVEVPSEDMKGRIIGREGRNIRAFEQATGVDLIVDESPESVAISSFDPVRREIARVTLMNLMLDGRIHPGRIEELVEKATQEVERTIHEAGERAAERAGVAALPGPVIEALGRLRFRTSYAQNVLDHSVEVAALCAILAAELGLNVELAKRAGLLHDIGKALGPEWEGPHALTGMEFLKKHGETDAVTLAVGAHHREIEPTTPESQIVIVADAISAARPGAREESLDNYLKRLANLEAIANSFPGVDRSYAVQAGREVRLFVKPDEVDDLGAARLADQVAKKIETDLQYPGQIKITVIREIRAQRIAR